MNEQLCMGFLFNFLAPIHSSGFDMFVPYCNVLKSDSCMTMMHWASATFLEKVWGKPQKARRSLPRSDSCLKAELLWIITNHIQAWVHKPQNYWAVKSKRSVGKSWKTAVDVLHYIKLGREKKAATGLYFKVQTVSCPFNKSKSILFTYWINSLPIKQSN